MSYVIAEPCIGACETECVGVCPVDCIHGPDNPKGSGSEVRKMKSLDGKQLYIDPDGCINCGACEPECPVTAIFEEDDLPAEWRQYKEKNAAFFR